MWPGSDLQFDEPVADDLGHILRITASYRGRLNEHDGKPRAVVAQTRRYAFEEGIVTLNGSCYTDASTCDDLASRLDGVQAALQPQITRTTVEGILPESGSCSIVPSHDECRSAGVARCSYKPGTVLSLERCTVSEFRESLKASLRDPATKELLRSWLRNNREP